MKRKRKGKYVSQKTIRTIKRLLDGYRIVKGYKIAKRKRRRK